MFKIIEAEVNVADPLLRRRAALRKTTKASGASACPAAPRCKCGF